jgi:hypothetical protein
MPAFAGRIFAFSLAALASGATRPFSVREVAIV